MQRRIIHKLLFIAVAVISLSSPLLFSKAGGAVGYTCPDGYVVDRPAGSTIPIYEFCADHMETAVECTDGKTEDGTCKIPVDCDAADLNESNCKILSRLLDFINILSALVGVIVVIMIIYGGIQYSTAGSDPQKVKEAKSKIFNALIAMFAYIFMYSFLQWIVPGGIF